MAADGSPAFFRLNPVDPLGRNIDPTVLAAAEEIFPRALEHGLKLLGDPAVVTNILEEVAATVSRVVKANNLLGGLAPIRNLPGYIFRAFVRQVNRIKRKQPVLVNSDDGETFTPTSADPSREFEIKILIDECLARCDFITQDMFWRRMQGLTWEEVGKIHNLSAHAAEVRFANALRKARTRLQI